MDLLYSIPSGSSRGEGPGTGFGDTNNLKRQLIILLFLIGLLHVKNGIVGSLGLQETTDLAVWARLRSKGTKAYGKSRVPR